MGSRPERIRGGVQPSHPATQLRRHRVSRSCRTASGSDSRVECLVRGDATPHIGGLALKRRAHLPDDSDNQHVAIPRGGRLDPQYVTVTKLSGPACHPKHPAPQTVYPSSCPSGHAHRDNAAYDRSLLAMTSISLPPLVATSFTNMLLVRQRASSSTPSWSTSLVFLVTSGTPRASAVAAIMTSIARPRGLRPHARRRPHSRP